VVAQKLLKHPVAPARGLAVEDQELRLRHASEPLPLQASNRPEGLVVQAVPVVQVDLAVVPEVRSSVEAARAPPPRR
jgi:hypothetical protein